MIALVRGVAGESQDSRKRVSDVRIQIEGFRDLRRADATALF